MSNKIVLALLHRSSALIDVTRWAVLREDLERGRPMVHWINQSGVAEERPMMAVGTADIQPPYGHPATVLMAGRRLAGFYCGAQQVRTAAGLVTMSENVRARPNANFAAVPGDRGLATSWAKSVGFDGSAKDARAFALRFALLEHRARLEGDGLGGATWIDVAAADHQVAVVKEVLSSPSVRHVLADEVGLGKTVEALMIWSALSASNSSLRTLVCCPKELVPQWCLEIRRRTERSPRAKRWEDVPPIYVPLSDQRVVDRVDAPNRRGLIVASHEGVEELATRKTPIDLLIVDEAHKLTNTQRAAVERLAKHAPHVLLLTATPRESARRSKGAARSRGTPFAWALTVVEPRCADVEMGSVDERLERDLKFVSDADREFAAGSRAPSAALLLRARELETAAPATAAAAEDIRLLVRQSTLMERVVRTRRRQIAADQKTQRRLIEVPVEYRIEEVEILSALRDDDAEGNARARIRRLASSSWVALASDSVGLGLNARAKLAPIREARVDAKLEALLDLCARLWREQPNRKVVIRCEYSATLDLVAKTLKNLLLKGALRASTDAEREAWASEGNIGPVATLDGGEDSILEALIDPSRTAGSMLAHLAAFEHWGAGGAAVLVARDVASVGLNLQFANDLVFYDLPWQFGLAEQWIGRLDRLGQRGSHVNVYTFAHAASPSAEVLELFRALRLFESESRLGSEIDQQVTKLIEQGDADELPWKRVVATATKLLDEREADDDAGMALDLPPVKPSITQADERVANRKVLRAFEGCGFQITHDGTVATLRWPPSKVPDAVELGEVRSRLRAAEQTFGRGNPLTLAILNEWVPELRVDAARLSAPRWFRAGATDFLTPRHPLLTEANDELLADPTLSLGCFRVRQTSAQKPGWFAVALSRTIPSSAGPFLTWISEAMSPTDSGRPDEDEELSRTFDVVDAGLQRTCTWGFPPKTQLHGWQLSSGGPARDLAAEETQGLLDVLVGGARTSPSKDHHEQLQRLLISVEDQKTVCSESMRSRMQDILDRAARYIDVIGDRVLRERERAVGSSSTDASMRGIRDRNIRRHELAETFFGRLGSLNSPELVESAVREVHARRVLMAALIEVVR